MVNFLLSLRKAKDHLYSEITEVPAILDVKQFPSLNGLRGVSILFVIVDHFGFMANREQNKFLVVGQLGVYIFFVISGFLITTLLLKEKIKTGRISLTKFYQKRVLRIIPLSYLFLIILFGLNHFFSLHIPLTGMAGAFLFLVNLGFFFNNWYTAHYWSLSFEEQFYLAFPIVLKFNFRWYLNFLFFLLALVIVLRQFDFLTLKSHSPLYRLQYLKELTYHLDGIIIGSLLSILTFKQIIPIHHIFNNKLLLHLLIIPCVIGLQCGYFVWGSPTLSTLFNSLLIAVLLISNIKPSEDIIYKILNTPIVSTLGVLSYSIYIWQQLFTFNQPWKGMFKYSDSILLNLIFLLIVSYISYQFYEKRFLNLKDKL